MALELPGAAQLDPEQGAGVLVEVAVVLLFSEEEPDSDSPLVWVREDLQTDHRQTDLLSKKQKQHQFFKVFSF